MDSLFPRTKTCPVGPRCALHWDPEEQNLWLLASRGASQMGGMDLLRVKGSLGGCWAGREFRAIFKICRRQGAGLNSVFPMIELGRNCSGCCQKVLPGFVLVPKITSASSGFWLKLELETANQKLLLLIFERQGQKIGFFLPASYCGRGCILRECMGGAQEIHTGFTFPDITVVSDRD